ncbi:hypothetical protein K1X45_02565 [Pseudochrobactrum sp. Wa41.01b-1]|uniref:hypothetical protein n=1 Tax=Pseudochrobactrum sp. Wa41.01b-1 TaxID=2864102 RepID=UPI001C68C851|nr:hypothetical protein [Pseudochrobactrum sp. Wa41.01b-1]QYM73343.1 hypothetical protein K1X45_02565 [Pseudochrobactrum sp. Wa41.01b-1]
MIENAKFTGTGLIVAIINGQQVFVPDDMNNRHRVMIADWEAGGNEIEPYVPEPEPVIIIPAVTLWERMTDAEAIQVNDAMATQSIRTRQIFLTANTFRSDHELWPLLQQVAANLFGVERAAELLA